MAMVLVNSVSRRRLSLGGLAIAACIAVGAGKTPLPPKVERAWWSQFYFATDRGRAGYDKYRKELSKLVWQINLTQEAPRAFAQAVIDVDRF
jgi:hypothetical protein